MFLKILFCLLYVPFVILCLPFMIIKALIVRPKKEKIEKVNVDDISSEDLAEKLSGAIRCKTVSMQNPDSDDASAFIEFHDFLDKSFPLVTARAEKITVAKYSLIYKIEGTDETLKPMGFLAHQDVVPAEEDTWIHPPFSGVIDGDFVYGRGAMDMKNQFVCVMNAVERLLSQNFEFKRSVYLCFGHDEEYPTKQGAPSIVEYFKNNGIELEFLVDEGGLVIDGAILGIPSQVALIGTCEKGYADMLLTADLAGGHASMPDKKTATGELVKAVASIMKHPMPTRWTSTTKELVDCLAPNVKFLYRIIFANRVIMAPAIKFALSAVSTITNAEVRTTFAPTMINGSNAPNVLGTHSEAIINVRMVTGQKSEEVRRHMQKYAGKHVKVSATSVSEPSPTSVSDDPSFKLVEKSIKQIFGQVVVAPFMFTGGTDARYYYPVCKNVFRFSPFFYEESDRERVHSVNERAYIPDLAKGQKFFEQVIINSQ